MKSIVIYNNGKLEGDSPLGGSEIAVISMARELTQLGYKVTVLSDCSNEGTFNGVRFVGLRTLDRIVADERPRFFISQTDLDVFSRDLGSAIRILWTGANHDVRSVQALMDDGIKSRIDHFFFVGSWQTENFKSKFGLDAGKIFVTRNGFDPALLNGEVKRDRNRLIYFSSPDRGLDNLLHVFPKIRKARPGAELHVFSDYEFYGKPKGEIAKEHPEIFKRMVQPGVHFHGNIKHDLLVKEVRGSGILAYPTNFRETSCMAAIESQAAGAVPVTSALAALNETVLDGRTGALIQGKAGSFFYNRKFIKAVVDLLGSEEKWRALSDAGKSRMLSSYTWTHIAIEWDKRFLKLLGDK
jgi:glycosyltransferase involved in cell wall biosynthesis